MNNAMDNENNIRPGGGVEALDAGPRDLYLP